MYNIRKINNAINRGKRVYLLCHASYKIFARDVIPIIKARSVMHSVDGIEHRHFQVKLPDRWNWRGLYGNDKIVIEAD